MQFSCCSLLAEHVITEMTIICQRTNTSGSTCVTRHAGPDYTSDARRASAPLLTVRVRLPSESLGTALHNLSQDSGDFFTTLSILLYLLDYPTPRSDYYRMYTSWPHAYFCSSSGSSINSSTIVGSTQTKNLVVFQFHLRANPF